jgi:membrane protease YdiL (CAAX protease family)
VPWNALDMALIALPVAGIILLPLLIGEPEKKVENPPPIRPEQYQVAVLMDSGLKIFFVTVATAYLALRAKATLRDLGFAWREFGQNVLVGLVAFVMIAPPVYAIQAAIVVYGNWKYEHPVIDMLQNTPDLGLFVVLAFSACIVAPISEEWFFRVVLQGWLQRAFAWLQSWLRNGRALATAVDHPYPAQPADHQGLPWPSTADQLNPYATPLVLSIPEPTLATPPAVEEAREQRFPRSLLVHWVPIMFSSVLFGLAHWGHGPAPITLTILALALGYVYQRTHSIVPVVVMHSLFNGFTMLIMYVNTFERVLLP